MFLILHQLHIRVKRGSSQANKTNICNILHYLNWESIVGEEELLLLSHAVTSQVGDICI
jgi:hypothetical protein